MTVLGVDVSHWNAVGDWSTAGLGFAIVKASEGTTPDARYGTHVAKAKAAGLLVGAYCFARNDVSLDAQAKYFATHSPGATFLAVDVEGPYATPQDRTAYLIGRIRAWDTLHRQVGLYMSESGFQSAGQDFDWVANWSNTPHRPYLIWQYHGGPLDRDRYEGTLEQLRQDLAPIPPAPPSDIGGSMDWQIKTAVPGTYTSTTQTGAGWIDPDTFVVHPMPPGTKIYIMAQVHIGGQWNKEGYLGSDATVHGRLVLAGDGTFVPTPPSADCSAVEAKLATCQHELDIADARIVNAITILGGTP